MDQKLEETGVETNSQKWTFPWWVILLFLILCAGAYFRTTGIDWAAEFHMHPDERFLTMVESAISPDQPIGDYFNTEVSSLNPHNRGYTFYVYGTLPLFIVRFAADILHKTGYGEVFLVGRYLSAFFDLLTIVLVFLIADRLFKKRMINLLAAAFYAASVLPIQLSHYFTVDSFVNFFTILTIYIAVRIMTTPFPLDGEESIESTPNWFLYHWQGIFSYLLFGLAFGMALASKVSAVYVLVVLPIAILVQLSRAKNEITSAKYLLIFRNLLLAAVISFLAFRIFQPYAFDGPGFFNFSINENWVANLKDLAAQSDGNNDAPPALQWARRPITFSWENLVRWGLGYPLGILSWVGFIWMAWRIFIKKDWAPYLLIWIWTGFFFVLQSLKFSRTMRYQIHIYPILAIVAASFLYMLWQYARDAKISWQKSAARISFWLLSIGVLLSTFAWAFAFTQIYREPFTRAAASEWIYQNIPTAINIDIETKEDKVVQHVPYGYGETVSIDTPMRYVFTPTYDAPVFSIQLDHVLAIPSSETDHALLVEVRENVPNAETLFSSQIQQPFISTDDPRGERYQIPIEGLPELSSDKQYQLILRTIDPVTSLQIMGSAAIGYSIGDGTEYQYLPEIMNTLSPGEAYAKTFVPISTGLMRQISIPHVIDYEATDDTKTIRIELLDQTDDNLQLVSLSTDGLFHASDDPRGDGVSIDIEDALLLRSEHTYILTITNDSASGSLAFYGSKKADESSWDDVIPLNMYGYSPFDYYDGLYRTDLNFEMYWDDNESKRERFYEILDQTDYIFITSNRQWGTTVRVPERYPLVIEFYQSLIGCPAEQDILWCFSVAEPGMFQSELGFELVEVFQSDPHIGNLISINTQFAEEAFTVYDHPKVFIFKKIDTYQPELSRQIFDPVNLDHVVHLIPAQADDYNGDIENDLSLMLREETWQAQQESGTWSEIFNPDALYNQSPFLAVIVWYFSILIISWIIFPFIHLAFPNFRFNGYPFAKLAGLLLLAFGSWWLSSNGMMYSKGTIGMVLMILFIINGLIIIWRREKIVTDIKSNWKQYLMIEIIALVFFLFFLLVRIGNPDLWHPAKGGEKPMDYSYFNAILKTNSFPAYDPWFAGGYINYYYYGFVIVGTLVKFLGIIPSMAYNLILPSLYSMGAIGAFAIGWNISEDVQENTRAGSPWNFMAGLFAALGTMFIGNLGTLRMIWHGFIRIAGGTLPLDGASLYNKVLWTVSGFFKFIGGEGLGYGYGNWYWDPSRAFPGEPITEFPMFTYLYADLHAHLIAIPITIFAFGIVMHLVLSAKKKELGGVELLAIAMLGGVVVGALSPTNTWDMPLYLILFSLAFVYVGFIHPMLHYEKERDNQLKWTFLKTGLAYLIFIAATFLLYEPFSRWYGVGYKDFNAFTGDKTPFWSYITHWGYYLFIYITWLVWESRDWMAKTSAKVIIKLKKYSILLFVAGLIWLAIVVWLNNKQVQIGWFVMLLLPWAAILMLRKDMALQKKTVLFLFSTSLFITLFVELMALEGDLGRMNTVFKFYMQAWTIMSICSAVTLIWLLPAFRSVWIDWRKNAWNIAFGFLTISVFMFSLFATSGKIKDRMSENAPHTLDGLEYMEVAFYHDGGMLMDLSQDYDAIVWMQHNIEGTPVIVEGHTSEYRWGSRFTINTGLPGVVGWNWHQRQQRAVLANNEVQMRVDEINQFYDSADIVQARAFLEKYNVQYIVTGQLESAFYSALGLAKFPTYDGIYWQIIYDQEDTIIYKVIQ
ncbi:MAG: glycosyltransferase family 39 protein [Anaerolineaceae bacterium]|nr:glycosyltransferase family 39 protein [Anaerolineaceae bacterium]